jgi:S-adenosylmethionine:tRNA ribosyltransferase-isomerase
LAEKLKRINIDNFDYELPSGKIARYPLPVRHDSKLLVYKNGKISGNIFKNIDEVIPRDSLIIFNDTKVIKARLLFSNSKGQLIEIFCLEPQGNNKEIESHFGKKESSEWVCLVGNLKKWKEKFLEKTVNEIKLKAEISGKSDEDHVIRFSWEPEDLSFGEILLRAGEVPLPPYIKRKAEKSDENSYQTIYARHEGSVAAPTAGLHFTDEVFNKLDAKGIKKDYITLHVGAGTFLPVKNDIYSHRMHSEIIKVDKGTIEKILNNNENVIAAGTTSLRTLESLYWIGVKIMNKINLENIKLFQWEVYEQLNDSGISVGKSMEAILNYLSAEKSSELCFETELLIIPGYEFKVTDILITNFHQPKSTLLLLVAAFIGESWENVYEYALKNDFRFLSYGDSSVLFR